MGATVHTQQVWRPLRTASMINNFYSCAVGEGVGQVLSRGLQRHHRCTWSAPLGGGVRVVEYVATTHDVRLGVIEPTDERHELQAALHRPPRPPRPALPHAHGAVSRELQMARQRLRVKPPAHADCGLTTTTIRSQSSCGQ
jgi:hypothetical protein